MPTEFEVGMAVRWNIRGYKLYGVVMRNVPGVIEITPVRKMEKDTKCYDETGSLLGRDADNVRLRDCPPPFTDLCIESTEGACYALANKNSRTTTSYEELVRHGGIVLDDGMKISDREMAEILDHPWRDEPQKSKPVVQELSPSQRMYWKAAQDAEKWADRERGGRGGPEFS